MNIIVKMNNGKNSVICTKLCLEFAVFIFTQGGGNDGGINGLSVL